MTMADGIPTDEDVLNALRSAIGGLTPSRLLHILEQDGHSEENSIRAIQRVFDRGYVELTDGAKLVEAEEFERVAA